MKTLQHNNILSKPAVLVIIHLLELTYLLYYDIMRNDINHNRIRQLATISQCFS